MKKKGSEIGEWKAFYCDSHDKAGVKYKKKIRYARNYNHFDEELRPIIRVESKGNHEAIATSGKMQKKRQKNWLWKMLFKRIMTGRLIKLLNCLTRIWDSRDMKKKKLIQKTLINWRKRKTMSIKWCKNMEVRKSLKSCWWVIWRENLNLTCRCIRRPQHSFCTWRCLGNSSDNPIYIVVSTHCLLQNAVEQSRRFPAFL